MRTPLATVGGFAHTLERIEQLDEPAKRYIGMIQAGADQIGELLDDLGLVARIEAGRYQPSLVEADTLELARVAAARVGEKASASGKGGAVRVDREPAERALAGLARCALRHGALEHVDLVPDGSTVAIGPVTAETGPILLSENLKDLGAAAARRFLEAIGGSLVLEGERLLVRLPPDMSE